MRSWLVLAAVLLLGAGGAVGFLAARGLGGGRPPAVDGAPLQDLYTDPTYLVMTGDVYKQLEVTDEQRPNLDGVLARYHERLNKVRRSVADLTADLREDVHAILTPAQSKLFEEIQIIYGESEQKRWVVHEIVGLRVDLALTAEQEGRVYPILFDAARERKELWKAASPAERHDPVAREAISARMREISERRDQRLAEVFTPEQLEKYRLLKEKRRSGFEKRGKGPKGDRKGPPGEGSPPGDPPARP